MTSVDSSLSVPWYRQRWPWILIALPASSVLACVALIVIALHDPDSLVVDDYYKQGLAINQRLERGHYAERVALAARGRIDASVRSLQVQLSSAQPIAIQPCLLTLVHPTRSEYDRRIALRYDPQSGSYMGELPAELAAGRWHLVLEPADAIWRLTGRVELPDAAEFELAPAGS
ncbi:MAG: hypothetical protein AMJ69_10745 [Gammaproteobacteria bacterium SG8_47]|nr:MAG: hypothetical protein AMJ69_10745 [Gammaproteobacteria bacterium SG8_47]